MSFNYRNAKNAEATARFWGKSLDRPDWYKVNAAAPEADTTEVIIFDVIGWPYNSADQFVRDLAAIKSPKITVRINSPGGDVFDGLAIFNALQEHEAHVTTRIEGLAASIASVIALGGDTVEAHASTMYMIHEPWVLTAGNQYDLRDVADVLGKIGKNLIDVYAANSSVGKRELKQMMADETWLTAEEAKDRGFIDQVITNAQPVKAGFDLSIFAHTPEGIGDEPEGKTLTKREIERALRDAGASRSFAKSIAAGCGGGGPQRDAEAINDCIQKLITAIKQ